MKVDFWKDKGKRLMDPELFSTTAEDLARKVYRGQKDSKGRANKPTQIRKFYDEVLRFGSILKTNPDDFSKMLPYIQMLNAKAAYAMGRDLISKDFKDFINVALSQIKDKDDFEAFSGLFEAFMGYYKYYDEKGETLSQGGAR